MIIPRPAPGHDYPGWPMDPAIEAFETRASQRVKLAGQAVASFDRLIHPVHRRGRVFGGGRQNRSMTGPCKPRTCGLGSWSFAEGT
jgi:hypothetical protein